MRGLLDSSIWFVKLRWVAIAMLVIGGLLASLLGFNLSLTAILGLALFLFAANLYFWQSGHKLSMSASDRLDIRRLSKYQIIIDWLALLGLIYITGGIVSPCLFFFFFHVVIAATQQPNRTVYLFVFLAIACMTSLSLLEMTGLVPHVNLIPGIKNEFYAQPLFVFTMLAAFSSALMMTALFSGWAASIMRRRNRQLSMARRETEESVVRLEHIYEMLHLIGSNNDPDQLLNSVVTEATRMWDAPVAFVCVKEAEKDNFVIGAANGVEMEKVASISPVPNTTWIKAKLKEGEAVIVDDLANRKEQEPQDKSRFDWLLSNGMQSLMVVPMKVGKNLFGAICIASPKQKNFSDYDAKYFQIFSDLLACEVELVQTNQKLLRSQRTSTFFYRQAAHEIKAPLSAIRSMLDLVDQGYVVDNEKIKDLVKKSNNRAASLINMVGDLLALAANETEKSAIPLDKIDMAETLRKTLQLYEAEAKKRDHDIKINIEKELLPVKATESGIERIFNNLISNAIKYTPEGGKINVKLAKLPEHLVMLSVKDSGIGISKEAQKDLFKQFYRAPNARRSGQPGTGLGLSITKRLVEDFGGTISVDSEEGQGAHFKVVLPSVRSRSTHFKSHRMAASSEKSAHK